MTLKITSDKSTPLSSDAAYSKGGSISKIYPIKSTLSDDQQKDHKHAYYLYNGCIVLSPGKAWRKDKKRD